METFWKVGIGGIIVGVLGLILLFSSCAPVSSGYVGVRTTFGKIHDKSLNPGLHFITPFIDRVTQLETRLKPFEVKAQASSKDLQVVQTVISVQHSLNGDMAADSYQKIGDLAKFDAAVVSPSVLESLKAVTAHYTAEELITKRDTVKAQIVDAIQKFIDDTLDDKGIKGAIHISNVAIQDFDFSAGFNASIESKVKAQQEALRAENEKERRITEAEAAAREIELAADAEAYKVEQISVQRAAAIEREAKALSQNPLLLQLRAIEKWSGKVPNVNMGGQAIPFLDVIKAAEKPLVEDPVSEKE
jgi:regulator of protease activity HflC (stomatin/prohibitin superfamily)